MPDALHMTEADLIVHAGVDSVAFLPIYLLGLKIFIPLAILAWAVLVPVNMTGGTVLVPVNITGGTLGDGSLVYSDIDKLSIANLPKGSDRYFAHKAMAYVFTAWTCYVLYKEYENISDMRLHFLASQQRSADQFTVLVRNVPPGSDKSTNEHVDHFFRVNHPEHYLTNQVVFNANKLAKLVNKKEGLQNWLDYYQLKFSKNPEKRPIRKKGFLGLGGGKVDAIEWYTSRINALIEEVILRKKMSCKCHLSLMVFLKLFKA